MDYKPKRNDAFKYRTRDRVYLEFLVWVQKGVVIIQCNYKTNGNLKDHVSKELITGKNKSV